MALPGETLEGPWSNYDNALLRAAYPNLEVGMDYYYWLRGAPNSKAKVCQWITEEVPPPTNQQLAQWNNSTQLLPSGIMFEDWVDPVIPVP
jgi:hypothetical protein